jgi:hypothetical protein
MTGVKQWFRRLRGRSPEGEATDGRAKLKSGALGVSATFPEAWPVEASFKNDGFVLSDPDHGVNWAVVHSPFPMNLQSDEEHLLEQDIRDAARVAFDAEVRRSSAEHPDEAARSIGLPITLDPGWSPVVDLRHTALDGGPAVLIIHRLAHQVGNEIVCGRILIPTANGVTELECRATDTTSGVRQSLVLVMCAEAGALRKTASPVALHSFFDDARHDSLVPDALSRVRGALAWLTGIDGVNLRVTSPPQLPDGDAIALEEAGCSIRIPPRYVRVRAQTSLAKSLVPFARVPFSVLLSPPWLMDVYRVDNPGAISDSDELRDLGQRMTQSWSDDGGVAIESIESRMVSARPDHLEVRLMALFRVDGRPTRAIQHWIKPMEANANGSVWRLSISVDADVIIDRFEREMDALAASWQRI